MEVVTVGLDSGIDVGLSERRSRPISNLGNSYVHPDGSGVRRNMECGRPSDQAAASGDKGPVTEYDLSPSVGSAFPGC
ncbi:hypothetical protein BDV40DRAFT_294255 [Aspergillus tamarii]|uniref:Uncharacterized protein n=1 Tax=Aspergillus tamarii TaxID=41984 RepID=A0A5N6UAB0_ASPTM|nr:hypothetical protein BDV40DRAFT_294255 [Aspergillus tamarii]